MKILTARELRDIAFDPDISQLDEVLVTMLKAAHQCKASVNIYERLEPKTVEVLLKRGYHLNINAEYTAVSWEQE